MLVCYREPYGFYSCSLYICPKGNIGKIKKVIEENGGSVDVQRLLEENSCIPFELVKEVVIEVSDEGVSIQV